jgi:ribosomal protein S18 acetylase RimI-like enzyme
MNDRAAQLAAGKSPLSDGRHHSPSVACRFRDVVLPTDRDAVRAIVEDTGFFHPDEVDVALELVDDRLARGNESEYRFVFAELDSAMAGYACYGPTACTAASFDLYWIAVDPRFQRQGVGRALMTAVESRITEEGGERIYIDTSGRPQYAPTRVFYERNGFRCEARLADFYAAGDDRLIYVKVLRTP